MSIFYNKICNGIFDFDDGTHYVCSYILLRKLVIGNEKITGNNDLIFLFFSEKYNGIIVI